MEVNQDAYGVVIWPLVIATGHRYWPWPWPLAMATGDGWVAEANLAPV